MKYFSMFSGIGGFEYGLEQSKHDFECVGYSEIDKYARSIYERHYPNHTNYGDATRIDTKDLPDFEFLVGGFPCQAFSIAGKRKGFNDTRGTLFFEIARVLRDKQPRYFLLENVKGLLSHEGGETLETIFRVCDELGYDVSWKIYNSKNYGVPQNRERIFIKGYFRGECEREVLYQSGDCEEVDGELSSTYYGVRQGRIHKEDEIMNTLTCSGENGSGSQLIILNNGKERSQGERVYDINGVSTTLQGTAGGLGGKTGLYKINRVGNVRNGHQAGDVYSINGLAPTERAVQYKDPIKIIEEPKTIRKLTPIECERLQGFPDNWTKYGKDDEQISDTQRYKCCGNAVTTNVITAIVNEMFEKVKE